MKNVRIIVGKGRSVPVGGPEGEWQKTYYQVEAVLDEGEDVEAAKIGLEHMVDHWLEALPSKSLLGTPLVSELNPVDIDGLPWQTYKTKEPAEPGHAGWLKNPLKWDNFADPVAEELAKAITQAGGKLELGDCTYTLSGDNKQFLGRHPKKTENTKPSNPTDSHAKMERNLSRIREGAERMGVN